MESNIKEKERSCQQSRLAAGFFLNLLINILIICVGTFYLIQFSQELRSLKEENQELKREVSMLKQVVPINSGERTHKDMRSSIHVDRENMKREVISSPIQQSPKPRLSDLLVTQFEKRLSTLQAEVNNIEKKVKKYHPDLSELSCPSGYRLNPYTGTCFRYVKIAVSWFDAKAYCEADGDYLATFDTIESAAWYRHQQLTAGWSSNSWIGGRRLGSTWRWYGMLTGSVSMSYWAVGQPNDPGNSFCLGTYYSNALIKYHSYWDDFPCSGKRHYACERKSTG